MAIQNYDLQTLHPEFGANHGLMERSISPGVVTLG